MGNTQEETPELTSAQLLNLKNQERKEEWTDILHHEFGSIVEIDDTIELDKHLTISPEMRFKNKMDIKYISFTGYYINSESIVKLKCKVCGHVWKEAGIKVLRRGCPACFQIDNNIFKARKVWLRSKQIIADKNGKLVKIPKQTIEHITKLDDKFGLKCGDGGHIFTTSHKKLRDNQWCPICAQQGKLKPIRVSEHVYRKNVTDEKRFERLTKIAELKQMAMGSTSYKKKMRLICSKCGETAFLSPRQLCENKYPCRNRCVSTHKIAI